MRLIYRSLVTLRLLWDIERFRIAPHVTLNHSMITAINCVGEKPFFACHPDTAKLHPYCTFLCTLRLVRLDPRTLQKIAYHHRACCAIAYYRRCVCDSHFFAYNKRRKQKLRRSQKIRHSQSVRGIITKCQLSPYNRSPRLKFY